MSYVSQSTCDPAGGEGQLDELLRRAVAGEELARNQLLVALLPRLRDQVRRLLNFVCRDAESDVLCSVVRRICQHTAARLPPTTSEFNFWVGRIVRNRCNDEWRYWVRRPGALPPNVAGKAGDDRLILVWPALQLLPDRDRRVLEETFYENKSSDEIGATMGLSEGAVRVLRHRALKRLAALLEKSHDHE